MNDPNREPGLINKLYRNPRRGMIFGVCAGLAEYFGFDVTVTRVIVAVGALFAFPVVCIIYLCLGLLLPVRAYSGPEPRPSDPAIRGPRRARPDLAQGERGDHHERTDAGGTGAGQ